MSYDVDLEVQTGPDSWTSVYWRNYTSNTAGMWRAAGCDMKSFDGKSAGEFGVSLAVAIDAIESDSAEYRKYAPPNGWGTLTGTLEFLRSILAATKEHPFTTVRVGA